MQQTRTAGGQDTSGHAAPVARRRVWHGQLARRPKAAETHVATLQVRQRGGSALYEPDVMQSARHPLWRLLVRASAQACSHRAAPQPAPDAAGPCPARARTLCSQDRSRSAVCRATATSTASVTSDDVAGTGAASVNGSGQSQLPVSIPQHWEQQMKSAPLGKRRVLQRCARAGLANPLAAPVSPSAARADQYYLSKAVLEPLGHVPCVLQVLRGA